VKTLIYKFVLSVILALVYFYLLDGMSDDIAQIIREQSQVK
jgi:hypothetical protein